MEDGSDSQRLPAFGRMPMRWSDQQPYPHSHHGTPAQEYAGFTWGSPPLPIHSTQFTHSPPNQRLSHQSLQPLVMPQWPSMLSSQSTYYPAIMPQAQMGTLSSPPMITPVSAGSSGRSGSSGRRTLTDDERRRMCKYAEENPTAKQTEIGNLFGVERSTVSKVLRQKERYLNSNQTAEGPRSPPTKRPKARVPDIEKALAAWVVREQKKGSPITDESIREQACYFASVPGPENSASNPINTPGWLEKFKQKHNVPRSRSQSRKDSVADPEINSSTASSYQSPGGISSASPDDAPLSSSPPLKIEGPEEHTMFKRKSTPSISTVFTEMGTPPACFTPRVLSPTSPFFTPDSHAAPGPNRLMSDTPEHDAVHRPSQTFPLLDNFMSSPTSPGPMSPKYLTSLDSPGLDEQQQVLDSIDEAMESHTVDPAATLLAGPVEARLAVALASRHSQTPTQNDAREALQLVLEFFETQPNGSLDLQEGVLLGRLIEKLQLKRRAGGDGGSD